MDLKYTQPLKTVNLFSPQHCTGLSPRRREAFPESTLLGPCPSGRVVWCPHTGPGGTTAGLPGAYSLSRRSLGRNVTARKASALEGLGVGRGPSDSSWGPCSHPGP